MRSEQEMLDLILDYANQHEDIRIVLLNGSRANPNARKDLFQDYDVVYVVQNVEPYFRNMAVPIAFGEMLIMQLPEDIMDPPPEGDGHYTYLMQFMDGNRIDLSFYSLDCLDMLLEDSLTVVLLDKDKRIQNIAPNSDAGYMPKEPTEKSFQDCCNEFWWVSPYVAKGLWRGEMMYAKHTLDTYVRPELYKMLVWYFGIRTGFKKAAGKQGKYLKADLEPEIWMAVEQTYADANFENTWKSLFVMGKLFRRLAKYIAKQYGYSYPEADDEKVTAFLWKIKTLPPDASDFGE